MPIPKLYIIVPCYNEEEVLPTTSKALKSKLNELIGLKKICKTSAIIFVDDGSTDRTWEVIKFLHHEEDVYRGIKLSKNMGHQNALFSGLMYAKDKCDISISLDADLQDDINVINHFVEEFSKGYDIVYGVRKERKKDTYFKKNSALFFYRFMKLLGTEIVHNHADYRLMSNKALIHLAQYKERNLFLRGIIPMLGFKHSFVEYDRNKRFAGVSKYPLKKMIYFAIQGITSFSNKPISLITTLGFLIFFISIIALIYSLYIKFYGNSVLGWSSQIISIWILGGLQLLSIGIIGEYIGKIYMETKERPRYFIEETLDRNN